VLVVVGSANPLAHAQLDVLRRTFRMPVVTMQSDRLADAHRRGREIERARAAVAGSARGVLALALSARRVLAAERSRPALEAGLAAVAAKWSAEQAGPAGLICTGGDTALAVCRALGTRALWPEGEVAPGVPWSALEHPTRSVLLVSKAGGFGGPRVLVDAAEFLLRAAQRHEGVGA
jgi:uncharacterized protein YgbK (DUF1537 family)